MKNKFLLSAVCATALATGMFSCQDAAEDVKPGAVASEEINLPIKYVGAANLAACKAKADITYYLNNGELNWVKDTLYCLCGDVRVPATKQLNIAAGTTIRGQKVSRASLTAVVGAKINATGTPASPIVFTTTANAGTRARGDWGGIILLGRARVNQTAPIKAEGFPNDITHPTSPAPTYGSNVDSFNGESSGTLTYVRIEYAGVALPGVPNSEKNGLTLAGVGSTTVIDHVQVSSGADDGFEWFGGTVNAKYLISHKNLDDDFDTDFGYSGKVQFGVVSRDPAAADVSSSNGFESDNDGTGSTATPRTSAIFSNFTVIGPIQCSNTYNSLYNDGLHLRRRTGIDVYNTIVVGWKRNQIYADPATILSTPAVAAPGDVIFRNNLAVRPQSIATPIVVEPVGPNNVWSVSATNVATSATVCAATNATNGGIYRTSGLSSTAWTLTAVNFAPLATTGTYTSPVLTQGTNANAVNAFFTANTTSTTVTTTYYIGARRVADDNGWNTSSGWINWQPETASYPNDGDVNIL